MARYRCVAVRADQAIESCAELIVSSKVRKVVFGIFDDNPQIEMKGWQHLRKNNVEVGFISRETQNILENLTFGGPYNEAESKRGKRRRFARDESPLNFRLVISDIGIIEFSWSISSPEQMILNHGPKDTVTYTICDECFDDQLDPAMFRYSSHFCRLAVKEFAAIKIDEFRCVLIRLRDRDENSIEFQWRVVE